MHIRIQKSKNSKHKKETNKRIRMYKEGRSEIPATCLAVVIEPESSEEEEGKLCI